MAKKRYGLVNNKRVQQLKNDPLLQEQSLQRVDEFINEQLLFQEEKKKQESEAQSLLDSYREESDFGPIQEKEFQAVYKAMEEDIEVAEALQQLEKQEKYAPKNQMESLVANTVAPEENEFYKDIKEERNKLHQKTFGGWVDFIRKQNREEVNKTFGDTPFYGENVTNADRRKWVAKQFNILGNFLGGAASIPAAYFTGDKLTKEENEKYEKLNKTLDEIERPIYETYQTEVQNKIDQIKQQYGIRTKNYAEKLGTALSGGLNTSGMSLYTSDLIDGEDLANVVKALDYLEDSKDLWDKGIDNRTQGNFSKIWSGLSYNGDNFLTLGLKDTSRDLGTAFAVGGGEEPLSETAQLRLNSYKDLETAKGTTIDPDDWFGIAQGFQETVGFILEMQASMGATSGVKALLKKGGKEYANKTVEKLIGDAVENSLLKNVGSAVAGSTLMSSTYETAANTYLGENVQRITNDEGEQILVTNNAQRVSEAKRLSNTRDVIDERIAHYNSELSKSDLDNEQKKAIKTELDNLTRIKLQLDNEYEQLVDKDGSIKTNISAGGALAEGYRNTASEFLVEKYVGRWVDDKFMPAIGSRLNKVPGAGIAGQSVRYLSSKVGESIRKTEVGTLTQAIWHSVKPGQIIQSPLGEVAEEMAIQFVPSMYGDYRDQMDELGSKTFYKNVLISTLGLTGGRSVLQTIGSGKAILSMTPEEKESYIKNLRAKGDARVFYNKIDNMDDKQLAQDIAMNTYGTFFHPSDVLARVANLRNPNKNPGDGTTAEERNKMAGNIEKTSFINLALKAIQTGTEKDLVNTLKRQMNKSGVSPETKENMQRAIDKVNKYSTILANNSNLFNGDTISNLEINRDMIEESLADINRELASLNTDLAWEDVSQFFRDANLPLEANSIEELFKSPLGMLVPSEGYQNADTMKVLDLLYVRDNLLPNSLKQVNDDLKYEKDPANREAIKEAREKKRKELEEKAKEEIKTEAVQQVVSTPAPTFVVEEEPVVTEGTEFAYDGQTYTYHENGSMTDSEGNVVDENLQAEIMAGSSGNMMTAEEFQELVEFSKESTPEHNEFDEALYNDVPEIQEGEEHMYFAAEANETPVTEKQKQSAQNYLDDIKRRTGKDPNFEDVIVDYIEMAGKERTELLFNGIEKVYRSMGMNTTSAANVYEKYFNVIANVTDAFSENVVSDNQNSAGKDPKQVQASTVKGETEVKKITTPQRKFKPEVNEIEPELGEDRRTVNPTLKLAYNFQDVTFDEETQTFSLNSRNLKPVEENDVVSNRYILDSDFMHKVRQEPNSLKVQVWDNPEQPMENTTWGALKERASKELSQEEYQEWYADNVPMVVVYTGKESNSQPIALSAVHRTNWYRPAVISDRNGLEEQQRVIEEGIANTRALRQQVLQTGSLPINLKFKAENSFGQLQFMPEGTTPLSLNESNPDSTIAVFMPDGTFKIDKTNFFEGTVVNAAEAIKSFQPYELVHINQVGINSDGSPIYFAFQTMNNSPVATHPNLKKPLDSKVHNTLRSVLIASTLLNNKNIPRVVSVIEQVYGMTLSKALEIQNEVKKAGYNIVNTDAEPSRSGKDLSAYLNLYTMTSHQGGFSQVINDGSKQNGLTFFNRNLDGSISYVKKGQATLFSTGVNRQQTFNLKNHNNINHILNGLAGLLDENNGALSSIKMHVNLSGLTDAKGKSLPVFDNNHNLQEHQSLDSIYKDYLRTNVVSHPIETVNGETKYITDVQPMFYFEPVAQEASGVGQESNATQQSNTVDTGANNPYTDRYLVDNLILDKETGALILEFDSNEEALSYFLNTYVKEQDTENQPVTDIYGNNHSVSTGDIITYQTETGPLRYILNEEGNMVMLREQPLGEAINTVQGKIDAINSSSLTPGQKNIAIGIVRGLSKNNTEYGSAERFSADEFASLNTNRIDSLTNEEQKQVVEAVKNLIINSIDFSSALKYSDIKNSIENGVDRFVQEQISQNKEIRDILRSIPGSQSILSDIDTINSKLEKVLEQKEKLIGLNGSLINEFNNIFNTNFYEDAESINEDSENFSQSFLEKDVKLSYSAFLKMSFFGFPKDMNNGTNKNTFGFTNYHSADLVNNKLLDISTRVNSSWNTLIDALSDMGEKTKQSLYQEMSIRFESLPEHLKNELLYNVVGRKNTIYKVLNKQGKKVTVKDETGAEYFVIENFEIGVLDENSSRDTVRMFEQVKSDFNSSKIVKNVQGNLFIDVEKAKEVHAKFRQAQIDRNLDKEYLKSLLAEIGITSFSDQTFDYIIDQSVNVPLRGIYGNSGLITQITKHLGYVARGNKDVNFENYSFIDQISGVIKNTVNVEVMLNKTFMGGSIYVGGKTMQSFIANTSVYDINHKLSTDESYIQMLQNIPSLRNNFLLKFLIDNPQFREMYGEIGFSSPEAYKVDNKDVPDNADFDKIAEQDNLATVLGLFTYTKGAELAENTLGNHPDLAFRKGRLPVHAISDKGRMIYLPTVLLDMQEGDITSTGDRFTLGEPVLNFLKEQLFDSELNRILQSYQQDTNIVAYDKSSKVFTLVPSMNSIEVVTENGVTLNIHDVLAETGEGSINPEYMEQIEAQAKQRIEDYINYEVDSKLTAGGTGLLRDLDFYDDTVPDKYAVKNIDTKYVNKKPGSNSIEKLRFTMAEFAINDILHKNNVQQMYLGDLAFYSKDNFIPTKMVDGQVRIDGEQISKPQVYGNMMIKIGSNLQKRTALLIAPGKKLANSQDPSSTYAQNYVHIALNDTESMSSTMKELIEAQYGLFDEARNTAWNRIEYYKNKIKELEIEDNPLNRRLIKNMNKRIKSLVAENFSDISDYFNITGTDAQEYLTWQTHLDILLRQGRISRDQHDSFKNKIESEELTTEELDIILQPIKPVHTGMIYDKVNNIMRPIYIKSSSFPLLPQLTKNLKIDSLREAMEKVEKDRKLPVHTSYQSANKIGALKTQVSLEDFVSGDYANNLETGITVLPYSDYKIQQETPSKEMKNFLKGKDSHVVMGSQFFKILFGNFINHDNRPIFPNRFNKEILKLAGIAENKEKLTGAELYNIYQSIYFNYSDTLKSQLEKELGLQGVSFVDESTVNQNKIVEKLKNILEKEITNRNYPDYLKDSIQLVQEDSKIELESVMMFDNNRYKFESLLQAVISNRLITHTLPGNGHISASSNGFERKAELDSLTEAEKGGIIWLNGIPRELKATIITRADGKKVLSNSEVLIKAHWKYYDSEGNFKYVDLSDPKYSKDIIEDGKVVGRKLNTDMIDKELLEMFSYRIPTSSHQSGAVIEVAGFLPSEMQDLLVVPKEHTTQFGEDYDIDKRQVYKYNYIVSTEGKIEKLNETHADNFKNYYPTVEEQKEMLYEEFQGYLQELKDEKSALKDLLNNESWYSEESSRQLFGLITALDTDREELLNAIRTTNSEIASLYEALSYEQKQAFDNIGQEVRNSMLRKMKIQLLENGLIDTYVSLYTTLDSSVQQKIFKPLVTDIADNVANAMQDYLNSEQDYTNFNILSDSYQRYLLKMGADGKGGIGVHSNAVVLEAQMQRLPVQDKVNIDYYFVDFTGELVRNPFVDSIGDLQFEGNLGQKAKTLDGGRDISDQHGENQNVSTDNISKQIMGKRNENSYTMSVYAFMAHMGFDLSLDNIYSGGKNLGQLHIPSLMMNQPILRDYTRIRQKYESMTAPYTSDQETAIIEELAALYGYPFDADMYSLTKSIVEDSEYNLESSTLTGQKLFDNLKQSNALKNPLMQMVILQKFLRYQSKARELSEVQQLLNLSTSKLGISYFEVNQRVNKLNEIAFLQMEAEESGLVGNNYTKLIGEFTDMPAVGYTKVGKYYWKPTTVEGKMFINSISTANSIMPALFPYDRPAISNMIEAIFMVKGLDPNTKSASNLKLKYDIMSNFVNFVNSDSNIYNNLENERKRLFFDTDENQSLGSILKELRRTNNPIMQNSLLNALTTNPDLATGIMEIKHTLDEQSTLDKSTKYEDFKDLLKDDTVLGVFNGEELKVSDLAQDLISYSLLSNDRNGALGFKNYIPVDFFKIVGDNRKNRNLFNNILHSIEGEDLANTMDNFVKQFFQHNPDKAATMSFPNFKNLREEIERGEPVRKPRFVSVSNTSKPTSLKQFDLYEFDDVSNSYKPVPILGSKGMLNEFSFKETNRESLIAANNPGSVSANGYLPGKGSNIQAKSLDLALQRFTSAKQIAEILLKTPENYRLKALLQQILPFIGDGVQVQFVEPNQIKGVAAYSVNEKVIKISKNFYETLNDFHKGNFQQAKERARNILIEEIIHSITVEEVSKHVSSNPVTGEVIVSENAPAYVRGLITAYEIARSKLPYDRNNHVGTYGSKDFIEFIANVFTNDSYRQNLEKESTGFITEFLKAVRNMFKYLQQQATGTYPKYDDIIFQDLLSLLQNDRGVQTTPVDSKKNALAQMKNNNPVAGTNRPLQKQNPTGSYKGLPVINTTEIINAEGQRGAAQYDRVNKVVKVNKPLLQQKYQEKAWTRMRELVETIHGEGGEETITSKAQDLPANQFQNYDQFEKFVIEHEFQHSIYSRQDFNREFPQGTKGDYETEINKRAIFALGLGIPLDIDKNDLKCN